MVSGIALTMLKRQMLTRFILALYGGTAQQMLNMNNIQVCLCQVLLNN